MLVQYHGINVNTLGSVSAIARGRLKLAQMPHENESIIQDMVF